MVRCTTDSRGKKIRVSEAMIIRHQVLVKAPISKSIILCMDSSADAERFFLAMKEKTIALGMKRELMVCAQIVKWANENNAKVVGIENSTDDFGAPTIDFNFCFGKREDAERFEEYFKEHITM